MICSQISGSVTQRVIPNVSGVHCRWRFPVNYNIFIWTTCFFLLFLTDVVTINCITILFYSTEPVLQWVKNRTNKENCRKLLSAMLHNQCSTNNYSCPYVKDSYSESLFILCSLGSFLERDGYDWFSRLWPLLLLGLNIEQIPEEIETVLSHKLVNMRVLVSSFNRASVSLEKKKKLRSDPIARGIQL